MKKIMDIFHDSLSMKSEAHIKSIFSRPMIFTDIILAFIMGSGFITWHHGIIIGIVTLLIGIGINLIFGITITVVYWVLVGALHPLIYQWGTATYNSNNQKLETIIVMLTTFIITIL